MEAQFIIRRTVSGHFYFTLSAENREVIVASEEYVTKAGAERGVEIVRKNAQDALIVDETGT